jgi:hypothetical protein
VVAFNGNDFGAGKGSGDELVCQNSLVLTMATRSSIISRCFDELQLSMGCIPTMSHPLATSGQTRELLKVRHVYIEQAQQCTSTITPPCVM